MIYEREKDEMGFKILFEGDKNYFAHEHFKYQGIK